MQYHQSIVRRPTIPSPKSNLAKLIDFPTQATSIGQDVLSLCAGAMNLQNHSSSDRVKPNNDSASLSPLQSS